ncbi:uncharacterized protein EHS24_005639 [Apiotrichum porosum]|uniref:Uncharacterized protein n=1 Tax=Apiotrichum porosum TaxID=105984 RepID=A0A427XZ33_9TREE|nr:uncharacterized protein EHS24_005639 [Apiotrichum porosum]RSH84136.1 hypothetical protein EHS24_005639 [Apiotrichum porosum]
MAAQSSSSSGGYDQGGYDQEQDHDSAYMADDLPSSSISSGGRRPAHLRPARRTRAAAHDPNAPLRDDYGIGRSAGKVKGTGADPGRRGRTVKNAVGGGMVASMKRGMKAAIALVLLALLNYAWFARTHKHVQAVGGWKAVLARPFTSTFSSDTDTGTTTGGHKLIDIEIPPQVRRPDHHHPGVQHDEM